MKITIEPETTQETERMKAPFVRTGVVDLVLAGRGTDGLPLGYYAGSAMENISGCARMAEDIHQALNHKTAVAATIEAFNAIAKAQHDAQLIAEAGTDLRNGKPLRIHQP